MRYRDGIGHIYCICCLANGKLYIGQTVKSIEKRFKEHKQAAKRGVPYRLYSAMRKYGVENFTIEEIIQVSAPILVILEHFVGKLFRKNIVEKLVNLRKG